MSPISRGDTESRHVCCSPLGDAEHCHWLCQFEFNVTLRTVKAVHRQSVTQPMLLFYMHFPTTPDHSYNIIEKQRIHEVNHVCKALKWFAGSTCILLHQG